MDFSFFTSPGGIYFVSLRKRKGKKISPKSSRYGAFDTGIFTMPMSSGSSITSAGSWILSWRATETGILISSELCLAPRAELSEKRRGERCFSGRIPLLQLRIIYFLRYTLSFPRTVSGSVFLHVQPLKRSLCNRFKAALSKLDDTVINPSGTR